MINEFDTPYWRNYYKVLNEWIHNVAKDIVGDVLSVGSGSDKDPFGMKYKNLFEKCNTYTTSDIKQYKGAKNLILDAKDMNSISDGRYDCIFCNGVIEHIDEFWEALFEMTRVLKPGGTLLISFPFNQQMHMLPMDFWRFTRPAVEYLLKDDYKIQEIKEMESENADPKFPKTYWVNATKNMTELCELAYKYGSDKCPQINHSYTPYYYDLLKDKKDTVKKVIEVGIGSRAYMCHTPPHYQTGASLRMWRDFFPNAQIYGADIERSMLFEDDRIKTFYCDQGNTEDIQNLIKQTGSDIDLFIDDGLHAWGHQVHLCRTAMPLLDKNVIYIIEDVTWSRTIQKHLTAAGYECYEVSYPKPKHLPKDRLIMVRHKQ